MFSFKSLAGFGKLSHLATFIFILFVLTGSLFAESNDSSPTNTDTRNKYLDPVLVTPNRSAESLSRTGSAASYLSQDDFQRLGLSRMIDAVSWMPGLSVAKTGSFGANASVFMRGGRSGSTLFLIDGIPLINPGNASRLPSIEHLSLAGLESIEVLRGSQALLYGSDGLAGVVNLITKKPSGKEISGSYRLEAGSFGTLIQQLSLGGTKGFFDYQVSGFHEYSDGVSKAKQTNVGTNALFDTDPYLNLGASGKFGISFKPGLRLGLEGGYEKYTVNYDTSAYQDGTNKEEGNDVSFRARFDQEVLDVWKFKTAYDLHYNSNTFSSGFRHYAMFQNRIALGMHSIDAGVDAFHESTSYATNGANAYDLGLYANYGFKAPQWFSATAVGRLDIHKEFGAFLTGGATLSLLAPFGLKARAAIGTGLKVPSLYQLYVSDPFTVGNKKLKPEQSFSLDGGIGYMLSNIFTVNAGVFRTEYSNLIDYVSAYPAASTYSNRSYVIAYGFESEVKVTPIKELTFGANYTYSVSEDQLETNAAYKPLLRQPKHRGGIFGNLRLWDRLEIEANIAFTGESRDQVFGSAPFYLTTDVTNAGYALVGARVSFDATPNVRLQVRGDNLFDVDYTTVAGYGNPGRAFYGGVEIKF